MILTLCLYLMISCIAAFSAFTVSEYYEWKDWDNKIVYATLMFIGWPIFLPFSFIVVFLIFLHDRAEKFANYLKQE